MCFLDVETTGTKPGYHEVIEVGFRHSTKGGLCLQVQPQHIERAEPEALKVSGYNTSDWADARPFKDVVSRITEFVEDATLVGHNICGFDVPMLQGEYENLGLEHDHLFRDTIDTQGLARLFLVPLGLNRIGMEACMKFIGEEYTDAHNAYTDAIFAEKLFTYISDNLKWHGRIQGKRIQEALFSGDE